MSASLVLINGALITGNHDPSATTAIAIHGDKILAVGTDYEMKDMLAVGGVVVDLEGRGVSTGLVDALHSQYALIFDP